MKNYNQPPVFTFEKLDVWQCTKNWITDIYQITGSFPESERFGLTSQIRRASVSVSANIVEGNYRLTSPDKKKFFGYSYSSIMEVFGHLLIAKDLEFLNDESLINQRYRVAEISKKINALYKAF